MTYTFLPSVMAVDDNSEQVLDGWKAIASYLKVSVRAAQLWERKRGLPVHRLTDQDKPRVRALCSELDAWFKAREGGIAEDEPPRRQVDYRALALVALVIASAILGAFAWQYFLSGNPLTYRVNGSTLFAFDEKGQIVWSHNLPGIPIADITPDHVRGLFVDLDGDGRNEFLYVLVLPTPSGGRVPEKLCLFGADGSLRWTRTVGRPAETPAGRKLSGDYSTNLLGSLRIQRPDGGRLVVGSYHHFSWAYQVLLLDSQGKTVSEYWHPGWLWRMSIDDLDGDGSEEIVLGGVNNSYGDVTDEGRSFGATLVVLDSRKMSGHGPVVPGDDRVVSGVPFAEEAAVVLFRGLTPETDKEHFYRVAFLSVLQNIRVTVGTGFTESAAVPPFVIFDFDRSLRLNAIQADLNFEAQILKGVSKKATPAERNEYVRERIGVVRYLKNRWVAKVSTTESDLRALRH